MEDTNDGNYTKIHFCDSLVAVDDTGTCIDSLYGESRGICDEGRPRPAAT